MTLQNTFPIKKVDTQASTIGVCSYKGVTICKYKSWKSNMARDSVGLMFNRNSYEAIKNGKSFTQK